ncbi:MAG TPA: hypothetical protein VHL56_10170 [Candidatus Limnocylindrales bacterium]|nr:hypothetical protein [Candidatus Limnocylindrales bacterium]
MFATLLGALPWPDAADSADDAVIAAVRAQEAANLEPITDGRLRDRDFDAVVDGLFGVAAPVDVVANWAFAASYTDRAVKQALPGPYTAGWLAIRDEVATDRDAATMRAAAALHDVVRALAAAGCPLVEIEETEAHRIGADDAERARFRNAHAVLTEGIEGTHLSLSLAGAAADTAGIDTVLAAPYASLAVDLINGPDNWNLVARAARERGVVVGALSAGPVEEPKEVLLWGAHYAASTAGRGIDRVGLGSAGGWTDLSWTEAERRMRALGEAARLAAMPPSEELVRSLDPRAVSARRAALGHGPASAMPPKRRSR